MTIYYLYVKTHLASGLKYLGKTEKDPYVYKGSGVRWKNHIRKHGYDVHTDVLLMTDNYDELVETGLFFSKLFNVVESKEWANLIPESGEGVSGLLHSEETKAHLSRIKTGKHRTPHNEETKHKIAESLRGRKRRPFSEEHKRKISEAKTGKPRAKTILS